MIETLVPGRCTRDSAGHSPDAATLPKPDPWAQHPISIIVIIPEFSRTHAMTSPESAVILLVEDREDDVLLIRKSFEKAELANPVYVVQNGEEAVDYLMGEAPFSNRNEYPLPDLIL